MLEEPIPPTSGHADDGSAVGLDDVEVEPPGQVGVGMPVGYETDPGTIRAPGRLIVVGWYRP